MTDSVVVDASLALKWTIREDDSDLADDLLDDWTNQDRRLLAPSWFGCEMANVVYQRVRRGLISFSDGQSALDEIFARITFIDIEPRLARRAYEMAHELQQRASYDAQYAALAEYLGCELWTADQTFALAAKPVFPWVRLLGE